MDELAIRMFEPLFYKVSGVIKIIEFLRHGK